MAGIESAASVGVSFFTCAGSPVSVVEAVSPAPPVQFAHALPRLSDSRFDVCRGWLRVISAGQPAQVARAAPC